MGPKQRKQRESYWDSDQADKDREDAESRTSPKVESESEEEVTTKKNNNNNKKKATNGKKKVESESSEEEVVKKPVAKVAAKKAAGGKKKVETESESESESESEEEEKPKASPASTKKAPAKPAAKKAAAGKKVEAQAESESESESEEEEKPKASPAKKAPAKPAASPAKKKAGKKQRENYWDSDQADKDAEEAQKRKDSDGSESESESSSEEEVVQQKKQQPAAAAAPSKKAAKQPPQPKGKKAAAKQPAQPQQEEKLSGFLLKQREAEEKKIREAEEKKKREEEQRIADEIADNEEEERRRIRNIEKNKILKEKKEKEAVEREERVRQERLEKLKLLGMNVGGNVKPKQPKKDPATKAAEELEKLKLEEEAKKQEQEAEKKEDDGDLGAWDDDDWETQEEKDKRKEEEERQQREEEEAKKKAEKEAAKAEKDKKKSKKNKDTTSTTSTTSTEEDKPAELRSPILCILGHVDTGKTSLLDRIRSTNVQGGEARGITQQIGASFIPVDTVREQTRDLAEHLKFEFKLPGLLLIDTPGHESFNNLRSRGSGLCDLAILVIDIMHGLEAQTIESINLLRMRKTPFIVALNKVDRIYDWRPCRNTHIRDSLKVQSRHAAQEFDSRVKDTIAALAGQELNASLYWKNPDHRKYVSLVPTSAVTGEGISDLMLLAMQLMQKVMAERVTYSNDLQCTLLEVKTIEGLGTTVDAVLVNGVLNEGDKIVVSGFGGPIVTTIRSLLTPPPLRETRVKSQLIPNKSVRASMGVKIVAVGLERAVPGTSLLVVDDDDDLDELKEQAQAEVDSVLNDVETSGVGVSVQASTLGSLEAFIAFLKKINVPVANVAIGPVHKKHVMACSIMRDKDPKYAILLAFDVKVEESALQAANDQKIQIMTEETIYLFEKRLNDHFSAIREKLRAESAATCIWPCLLDVISVFRKKDPILVGVRVKEGTLRIGTPLCQPENGMADIGSVTSIKLNDKDVTIAKKDDEVSIAINDDSTSTTFGRHFDDKKLWYSKISRDSIDALKNGWSDELTKQDVQLIKYMKTVFKIQ